ncbi:MAG: hypothetical protein KDC53_17205 [Saprospiraceae bacterium]|nr:hypothetical protein [Saprospiraceae bacterium]
MKHLIAIVLWILATLILSIWGHWILGLFSSLLIRPFYRVSPGRAILTGLGVGMICWAIPAILINQANDGVLAGMIGNLLTIGSANAVIVITSLLGGIGLSLSAWLSAMIFRQDILLH